MTPLQSIQNFRDLGGLRTKDGRRIRQGLLLRSGSLISVTDEDVETLRKVYDLRRVFDLRSTYEIGLAPDKQIPGVENINLELLDLAGDVWKKIVNSDISDISPMEKLVELGHTKEIQDVASRMYVFLAGDPKAMGKYTSFLRYMADDTPGATLWHCSFGKDRTGVASALMLGVLGCSKQTILEDYAISNITYAGRVKHVLDLIPENDPQRDEVAEVVRTFIGANVKYFEAGLDNATARYGSAMEYCRQGLGISENEIESIRAKYLE